ncbi:uncharacterized protein BDV14DRAFT_182604 [Aspergillus stella-maris]|uniref:uncharacterized protein n=1 Tax=Aspergillus stella-maris TaxID=1810926 RepID=UPI003CCD85B0
MTDGPCRLASILASSTTAVDRACAVDENLSGRGFLGLPQKWLIHQDRTSVGRRRSPVPLHLRKGSCEKGCRAYHQTMGVG